MSGGWTEKLFVYVGTYTHKASKGIYLFRFDAGTGELTPVGLAAEVPNPTFLTLHPQGRFLYAVSELRDASGRHGSSVNSFAVNSTTGELTLLNRQSSQGEGPCHVSVDQTGRFALVANYASGSAALLPIAPDGRLGEATDVVQHQGSSVNPTRQTEPHAHSITPSPDNRFALVADLGVDRIMVYRLDLSAGRLIPNDPAFVAVAPGAGPRHIAFHPNRPFVYLINELDNTVILFTWDAAHGRLGEIQTTSTLPREYREMSQCAEVQTDRTGRFLYGSNRGHDSLAIFRIEESSGKLTVLGHQATGGKWPRHFALDPSGAWLLAAHQNSDSLVPFRRDPETGLLSPAGRPAEVSMPVCVRFVPRG